MTTSNQLDHLDREMFSIELQRAKAFIAVEVKHGRMSPDCMDGLTDNQIIDLAEITGMEQEWGNRG